VRRIAKQVGLDQDFGDDPGDVEFETGRLLKLGSGLDQFLVTVALAHERHHARKNPFG
jgi:hypothetical protein